MLVPRTIPFLNVIYRVLDQVISEKGFTPVKIDITFFFEKWEEEINRFFDR
jgi:hypothetical protein